MLSGDDHGDRNQSPSPSSLPSIRELFGIRSGDNLDTLVVVNPQRAHRSGHPPPSAYPQAAARLASPGSPEQRHVIPARSNSFSSGQLTDSSHIVRGTHSSPTSRSTSSSVPYATSPRQANPRSTLYPHASHSPGSAGSQILPPISSAIPEILPGNRVRAVSDTEALTRGGLSPASNGRAFRGPQPPYSDSTAPHHHPSLLTDSHLDTAIDQRRHVGRSAVQGASGAHYPSSNRSHSHSITQSSGLSEDAVHSQLWSTRSSTSSRNAADYSSAPSTHEYSPHPFSPASLAARQGTGIQYPASHHVTEGPVHPSSSRGSERAPPSSFPQQHGSGNRPRSGHSSEGDETKAGYGKYECEYCSKRFNRPSSLRIHINTHTGAKPFQCPFPNCGRRFSVMSNMRRHARTHGTTMLAPSADDDHNSHYQGMPMDGEPALSSRTAGGHLQTSAGSSERNGQELSQRWPESAMEIDELEDEEDDEMDTDAGGGSSESDGYPPSRSPGRLALVNSSTRNGGYTFPPSSSHHGVSSYGTGSARHVSGAD